MCGLIGYFASTISLHTVENFERALKRLSHRGPDDHGYISVPLKNGEGFLGHTRLSIIDLTSGGHQPMRSACGRYTLVFNGEIYNYRELRDELVRLGFNFSSNSDSEVLLTAWIAWGDECLTRLTGMFAFVVFDETENTVHCARDPFGIKPFFYCSHHECVYFGSELPALMEISGHTLRPNFQKSFDYLVGGRYDDDTETFFEGVNQLMPGHLLSVNLSNLRDTRISRWWWPSIEETCKLSFSDAAKHLRELFIENVRLHLRSDVPIGAALSGGLDSSAIVCAMRHLEPDLPIHTFSFVARNSAADEEKWVDIVNQSVGAVAHKVLVTPQDWSLDLDEMIQAQGEPFGSTSIYAQYRVYQLAKKSGVTVTLDGQGADELLAGYMGYPVQRMRSLLACFQPINAIRFLLAWRKWPGRSSLDTLKQLTSSLVSRGLRSQVHKLLRRKPVPTWVNSKFVQHAALKTDLYSEARPSKIPRGRHLMHTLRESLTGNGLNALLRHGDRNSMRWSVESRVPFLTSNMAEFLLSLPEKYLISELGETKHIFRLAMRGIVPDSILERKDKIGFESPERAWLIAAKPVIEQIIAEAPNVPILNAVACESLISGIINDPNGVNSRIAWRIINYIRWYNLTFHRVKIRK